tara:strand:- start:5972 stop:6229 length:258 start_codon:yes stop_codon:yes gene_type:complete
MSSEFLAIIGAFISLLLMVNAFFIKDLVKSINEVKLELARLVEKHDSTSDKVNSNIEDIKDLYKTLNDIRDRLSKVEGDVHRQEQ